MVQAFGRNAGGPSPRGGVSQEETQDVLQGFHLPSSMEYPVIPRAAGEVAGEKNCLGLPTEKLIEMVVERINQWLPWLLQVPFHFGAPFSAFMYPQKSGKKFHTELF